MAGYEVYIRRVDGDEEPTYRRVSAPAGHRRGDGAVDIPLPRDTIIEARARGHVLDLGVVVRCFHAGVRCHFLLLPRSSTGRDTTIRMANSVGFIDSGYEGPLQAIVDNPHHLPVAMERGRRLFQIVPLPMPGPIAVFTDDVQTDDAREGGDAPERGTGGLGSTGN